MSDLNVEVNGDGPDLVLLHGWGLNLRVWDGLVDELRDRFRVIAVDLPGHGKSPWNLVQGTPAEQAWMIHTTLATISNRYSLLGWSLGAQIALDLAAAMPAPVERLALVAATPRFAESEDWPHGMKAAVLDQMAMRLRQDYRRTVADFLELQVRGSVDGTNVLDQLRRALVTQGEARPEALEAGLRTLAGGDLRATLAHVRAPTLVVGGQYDRITLPAASNALAHALPDGRYVEIRRAAHAPFLSHRAEFAALVSEFLLAGAREGKAVRKRKEAPVAGALRTTARTPRKSKVARKGGQIRGQRTAGKATGARRPKLARGTRARTTALARTPGTTRARTTALARTPGTTRARATPAARTPGTTRTRTAAAALTSGSTRAPRAARAQGGQRPKRPAPSGIPTRAKARAPKKRKGAKR